LRLYEIADEYLKALDNIQVNEDGEIINMEDIESLKGEFDAKTEAVACYIKELKANADALKAEKEALDERMKSALKKADWLSGYLSDNMRLVGKTKFETPKCKLSFRKSSSVFIADEELLDKAYMKEKITYTPDKTAIKDAIKGGSIVVGAELIEKESLQIK